MPFGLINIGATFKHVMDITFHKLNGQSTVVYLDNIIVFSKQRLDHIRHLKNIFEQWHKYRISLIPKKSIFVVSEGNLLGCIITKSGIKLDLYKVRTITQIPFLVNKMAMQPFLGKSISSTSSSLTTLSFSSQYRRWWRRMQFINGINRKRTRFPVLSTL